MKWPPIKAINPHDLFKKLLTTRVLVRSIALGLVVIMVIAAPHAKLTTKDVHKSEKPKTHLKVSTKPSTVAVVKPSTVASPPTTPAASPAPPVATNPPNTIKSSAPVTTAPASAPSPGKGVSGLTPSSSGSGGSNTSGGSKTTGSSTGGSKTNSSTGSNSSGSSNPISYESENWSGYMSTVGTFTAVSGNWVATSPTGNGISTSADASWVGIGGVSTNDLIQTGTDNIVSANGNVSASAFYELLPNSAEIIPSMTITPGDHMSASINEQSSNIWLIDLNDLTTGQSFSTTVSYNSSLSSAEWIEEDPSYGNGRLVPFDNFGIANFSSGLTTINGTIENIALSGADGIKMVNGSGQTTALPSALSNGNFIVSP